MTITKLTAPFLLATTLLLAPGCDGEDPGPETELRAELDPASEVEGEVQAEGEPGHHRRGHHDPAERLCQEIACSDDQRSQIDALFAARKDAHEAKRAERGAHEAKRAEHDAKLAAAFRAETFDPSVLDHGEDGDRQAKRARHLDEAAGMIVSLHAVLNAEQRAQLADRIAERGPGLLHGPRGKRGHHGPKGPKARHHGPEGKRGEHGPEGREHKSPEQRLARHVEHFCAPLDCSEDQKDQLGAAFMGAHEQRRDMPKPNFEPLADAFRADSLDAATVKSLLEAGKPDKAAHIEGFGNVIAEVHDILTPEQRSILADKIEAEGLRGVMGKGHHGKRGKHGKRNAE